MNYIALTLKCSCHTMSNSKAKEPLRPAFQLVHNLKDREQVKWHLEENIRQIQKVELSPRHMA